MNGKPTRISLDEAVENSETDWKRLRSLTDEEIEAAVAGDPDSYLLEDIEEVGRRGASYRYEIYTDRSGRWRWRLLSADGEALAFGARSFSSRSALQEELVSLRQAMLGARSKAA